TAPATITLAQDDHAYRSMPHEAALDLIAALGFEGFKLLLWEGESHIEPHDVRADIAGWAGRLAERVRSRGLEFVDVVCLPAREVQPMAVNHPSDSEREASRAFVADMIDFAARLDAPGITMFAGLNWPAESHEASLQRACEELRRHIATAHEHGIALSIEPHV